MLIGLPLVLVLAWYHGDRGQRRISAPELVMITLLFMMIGGGIFWMFERDRESRAAAATDPVAAAPAAIDPVAVLPSSI